MKDIKEYEDIYRISKDGRVFSIRANKFLSTFFSKDTKGKNKYKRVQLSRDGIRRKFFIHRLVAENFLSKGNKECVNHKDGNKINNLVDNLEWVTYSENNHHAIATKLAKGYNGTMQKRNTSGYVGVTKSGNKWKSQIRINNHLHYLGLFETAELASSAYLKKLNSMHKENKWD